MIFEPTIPVFERAKTVDALDRAATVIGLHHTRHYKNLQLELLGDRVATEVDEDILGVKVHIITEIRNDFRVHLRYSLQSLPLTRYHEL
jgi:hypothetical protein